MNSTVQGTFKRVTWQWQTWAKQIVFEEVSTGHLVVEADIFFEKERIKKADPSGRAI